MIFILGSIVNMNEGVPIELCIQHENLHFDCDKIFIRAPKMMRK